MRNKSVGGTVSHGIIYILFLIISFFVIYPLVYVVSAAFSPGNSIASLNIVPFADGFTVKHFVHLFKNTNYGIWFLNTLKIAIGTSLLTIITSSMGA